MATSVGSLMPTASTAGLIDGKASLRPLASSQCVTPPSRSLHRALKPTGYMSRKLAARNVIVLATGEATPDQTISPEVQELIKPVQEAWEKVDDKYAVSSLIVAGVVLLWGSVGLISAIDRLPLIPGVLELVGIGYTGWFAYQNLVFKPDREALVEKIKCTYKDIIGSS